MVYSCLALSCNSSLSSSVYRAEPHTFLLHNKRWYFDETEQSLMWRVRGGNRRIPNTCNRCILFQRQLSWLLQPPSGFAMFLVLTYNKSVYNKKFSVFLVSALPTHFI